MQCGLRCEVEICQLEGGVGVGRVMDVLGLIAGEGHDRQRLLALVLGVAQGKRHRVGLVRRRLNHL
uniref:Uncharacterized protein n=1 Tax=Salix viminalis TaxID=40686 RepID=A0A6N2KNQ2_SALVM